MPPISNIPSRSISSTARVTDKPPAEPGPGGAVRPADRNLLRTPDVFEPTGSRSQEAVLNQPHPLPVPAPSPVPSPGGVTLFPMPESGPQPIVDAINGAKASVDLSVYMMTDPAVINALTHAAGRGVQVRVMLEPRPVGVTSTSAYDLLAKQLQSAGVQVQPTPPRFDSNHNVDHAKFLVVDHQETLLGTGNLVRSGLGDHGSTTNRDFWLEDTRPQSAREAETLFNDDWNRQDTSDVQFQNLVVTPENSDTRLLALIDGAQKTLLVYNQEMQDPTVIQHLIEAKKRGVDVQVLSASPVSAGTDANKAGLDQLRAAGIPAHELTKLYLHAKAMVADDQVFVGSQNFSSGGLHDNRELGEIVREPAMVKQLTELFQSDFASTLSPPATPPASPVTPEE